MSLRTTAPKRRTKSGTSFSSPPVPTMYVN
jgi:hypothetical protein